MARPGGTWPWVIGSAIIASALPEVAAGAPVPAPDTPEQVPPPASPSPSAVPGATSPKSDRARPDPARELTQKGVNAPEADPGTPPGQPLAEPPSPASDMGTSTTGGMEQYGSPSHVFWGGIGLLIFLAALAAAAVLGFVTRRRRKGKQSNRDEEPDVGYDNMPYRRRTMHDDPRDRELSELKAIVLELQQRVAKLELRDRMPGPASPAPDPYAQSARYSGVPAQSQDNYYNRKDERQNLPEDNWPPANRPPAQNQYADPLPAPPPASGSLHQLSSYLSDLFNRANKSDFDALAADYGAESYTNDRRGDLSLLIKDDTDRFWVVPVPGQPDRALMIPGFTVKKSWLKLRQAEIDHPLAHHFELRRGDRVQVIEPAVLRRNSNNFWELERKGVVAGIS